MAKKEKQHVDEVVVTASKDTVNVAVDDTRLATLAAKRGDYLCKVRALESARMRSQLAMKKMEDAISELDGIAKCLREEGDEAERQMLVVQREVDRLERTASILGDMDELEMAGQLSPAGYIPYGTIYGVRYYNGCTSSVRSSANAAMLAAGVPATVASKMQMLADAIKDDKSRAHDILRACYCVLKGRPLPGEICASIAVAWCRLEDAVEFFTETSFPMALAAIAAVSEARVGKSLRCSPSGDNLFSIDGKGERIPGELVYDGSQPKGVALLWVS